MSGAAGSGNLELELRSFRGAAFGQREGGRAGAASSTFSPGCSISAKRAAFRRCIRLGSPALGGEGEGGGGLNGKK